MARYGGHEDLAAWLEEQIRLGPARLIGTRVPFHGGSC